MLESSLLSDPKFYEWANRYVLFCHITTRINDKPYDNLYREMGVTGFPTLAFATADGALLAHHKGERSVAGLTKSEPAAAEFAKLLEKAAAGDDDARLQVFLRDAELGMVKREEFEKRVKGFTNISAENQQKIDALFFETEIDQLTQLARKGGEDRKAAAKRAWEWFDANKIPERQRAAGQYWSLLIEDAKVAKSKELLAKLIAANEKAPKTDFSAMSRVVQLKKFHGELVTQDKVADLKPKADAGDAAAKYQVLILSSEIRSVSRAAAEAMAKELGPLDETQQKKVADALVDLEIFELQRDSRAAAGITAAYKKIEERINAGKIPERGETQQMFWEIGFNYVLTTKDEAALQFLRDKSAQYQKSDPSYKMLLDFAAEQIAESKKPPKSQGAPRTESAPKSAGALKPDSAPKAESSPKSP
jgi:hypothetical protein